MQIFSYQFNNRQGLNILDLGCGDGILTQLLIDNFPNNQFNVIDGSQVMIQKAKERLNKFKINYNEITFEQFAIEPIRNNMYDFVFSSMAIHHLPFTQKEKLFEKIYHELSFNGLFINIDVVLPESDKSEEWQFNLWRDWVAENDQDNQKMEYKERNANLTNIYKNNLENKPSGLFDQLSSLNKIGYKNVDCFFKHGIFTLFGGTK
jgi:tRNA (cmo5U34)-methyltransferase